ncbi:inositol monophosphatase family protein [Paenibacillus alkalitolerans]|uniref:inositol monophosphatase family protein n=1 Tax=Paenibacillus alkalitolerans TaxID=2799335 RepID=UPI0018F3A586|nr:inositol monophosphatase family protein [Paenibacillus alkalitolerans]
MSYYDLNKTGQTSQFLQVLKDCVAEAGNTGLLHIEKQIEVDCKASHKELVTLVDRQNEQFIVNRIKEAFPHHKVMGEESYTGETFQSDDYVWIIDPIDGTTNYVHQKQCFAVSVALYHQGEGICGAVYNPSAKELFWVERGAGAYLNGHRLFLDGQQSRLADSLIATYIYYNDDEKYAGFDQFVDRIARTSRGVRMIGCGSLELAYVACGRFSAYFSFVQKPWDFAAGKLLIEEAGGIVTGLNGKPVDAYKSASILAGPKSLHEEMTAISNAILAM